MQQHHYSSTCCLPTADIVTALGLWAGRNGCASRIASCIAGSAVGRGLEPEVAQAKVSNTGQRVVLTSTTMLVCSEDPGGAQNQCQQNKSLSCDDQQSLAESVLNHIAVIDYMAGALCCGQHNMYLLIQCSKVSQLRQSMHVRLLHLCHWQNRICVPNCCQQVHIQKA